MSKYITVGRRLLPRNQIALIEPYESGDNPDFQPTRDYHGRVVLLSRETLLTEDTPQAFAKAHGFRMLNADRVATNPAVHFQVESYLPREGFTPAKAYATRLLWRDLDGNDQSKLLLSEPETVLLVTIEGEADAPLGESSKPSRGGANSGAKEAPSLSR